MARAVLRDNPKQHHWVHFMHLVRLLCLVTVLLSFHFGAALQDLAGPPLTGASAATTVVRTAAATPISAPVAAPTQSALAAQSHINAADTAWMHTSTALVLLMTLPGIALFYGGMIRRKTSSTRLPVRPPSPLWSPCFGLLWATRSPSPRAVPGWVALSACGSQVGTTSRTAASWQSVTGHPICRSRCWCMHRLHTGCGNRAAGWCK
jgi:hypothetical protein